MQILRQELKFALDQRQKINTKGHMQISGLDPKPATKIAKTLQRRVLSNAQETFMEVDSHSDSGPDSTTAFLDNSNKSNDPLISGEPYLPLNILLSGMFLLNSIY